MTQNSVKVTKPGKSRMLSLLAGTALLPLAAAQSQPAGVTEVTPSDLLLIQSKFTSPGNGGGDWISEIPETVAAGEISKIRVCHGRFINRITADYGPNTRGTPFGGPGGNCDDFVVKVGSGEFIKEVRTWSGDWMNAIQFVTNQRTSDIYGDVEGGAPSEFIDPNGGALRQIDGKFGAYLNQARFSFGLPFTISNFKLKIPDGAIDPERGELQEIDTEIVDECGRAPGGTPFEANQQFENSVSDEHTFRFGSETTLGFEQSVTIGPPEVLQTGFKLSASQTFSFDLEDKKVKTNTRTRNYTFFVNTGQAAEAVFTAKKMKLNVPFTYTISHYKNGNPKNIVRTREFAGQYEGVLFGSAKTSVYEIDCKTKKRLAEYADGSTLPPPKPEPKPVDSGAMAINQSNRSNNFSGTWSCPPYGTIDINQSGTGITGKYSWGGVGTFQGDAKDRFMRVSVNDSAGKPLPSFFWELTLSGDGNRVDGKIIDKTESAAWGCSRIGAP